LAVVPWPSGDIGALLALVLVGALVLAARYLRMQHPRWSPWRLRAGLCAGAAALVLLIPWLIAPRGWPMSDWLFVACDVGQGDALVVRTGPNSAMLVDAGLDGRDVDRCLRQLHVTTLDVVVITHFHADHVGGLSEALRNRAVGAVFATPTLEPEGEAMRVQRALADRGLVLQSVRAGERHQLAAVSWQVLWPSREISQGSVPNNASVVLLVEVNGLRILLPGDVEPEAQAALVAEQPAMNADIAKVPHHGSRFQDPRFAQWAQAQLAVVTVGEGNDYGHPAATALEEWAATGAAIWRTDLQGSIAVARREDGNLAVVALKS
ncbi:MAG: MBL fold metallo-hydrolase, partial [Actinomycetota bacterium]|nr:MBL fold metallo-hydrolase [Actinomycetota bacterium]